jgi:hypothetical protein
MNQRILTVGGGVPGGFATIGAALARAEDGSTITVHPGRYEECLVVNRRVTISAEQSGTVSVHAAQGSVLIANGSGAQLRGLELSSADEHLAAVDVHLGEVALDDCRVEGAAWVALLSRLQGSLAMRSCEVRNPAGAGAVVISPRNSTVEDTVFADIATSAVVVGESGVLTMRRCTLKAANGNGICVNGDGRCTVEQCEVVNAGRPAIAVEERGNLTMVRSTVRDSTNVDLYLRGTGAVTLTGCRFTGAAVQSAHVSEGSVAVFDSCELTGAGQTAVQAGRSGTPPTAPCSSPRARRRCSPAYGSRRPCSSRRRPARRSATSPSPGRSR